MVAYEIGADWANKIIVCFECSPSFVRSQFVEGTKVSTKVKPPFFSEAVTIIIMKFGYNIGKFFTKLGLFSHKAAFTINTLLPPLRETLYAAVLKLYAEASELFTHAVF